MSQDHTTERLRAWARRTRDALDTHLDLDVVRGWSEHRDPTLDAPHALPPLLSLESPDGAHQSLHGPRALIGRFSPQHGPVDLTPTHLHDHELYRVCAPHALLELTSQGWTARAVAPRAVTQVSGRALQLHDGVAPLTTGDTLTLGVHTWRVTIHPAARARWEQAREALLGADLEPSVFLKRFGGVCGPRHILSGRRPHVLGRTFSLDDTDPPAQPDWDLSGLPERERRYVAFRHAELRPVGARDWEIASLGSRQRVYVNRVAVDEPVLLDPGDEIGLGALTFLFHHPLHDAPPERAEPDLPEVVDWDRDHTRPRKRPLPLSREDEP